MDDPVNLGIMLERAQKEEIIELVEALSEQRGKRVSMSDATRHILEAGLTVVKKKVKPRGKPGRAKASRSSKRKPRKT